MNKRIFIKKRFLNDSKFNEDQSKLKLLKILGSDQRILSNEHNLIDKIKEIRHISAYQDKIFKEKPQKQKKNLAIKT